MYETYFLQNWLPRWNQILTQLSFIHNLIITGIQWMVCWFTVEPQEQLSITFVLSSYAHTHLTTLLTTLLTECRATWVSYEPFKDGTWKLIILFHEIICFDKFPTKFPTYELFLTILNCLHISSPMKSTCPHSKKHSSISGFGKYYGDYYYFPHYHLCPKLKHRFVFHGVNPLSYCICGYV